MKTLVESKAERRRWLENIPSNIGFVGLRRRG
jgi:hypothetical protein